MGSMIAACAGSAFVTLICSTLNACSGHKKGIISRIPYLFLFFIAGFFALFMSLYGEKEFDFRFTTVKACNSDKCVGNGSVYRVSFCLFIFELLHVLVISAGANSFHWLWFPVKVVMFVIAMILSFTVGDTNASNLFFNGYADYFARYSSAIYLIIQILILISWAYDINEHFQKKGNDFNDKQYDIEHEGNKCNPWFWSLGLSSFGLLAVSLVLCILFFVWFGSDEICTLHRTLISLNIIFMALVATVSIVRGDGSFFVSSIVSFYCTFLLFSALQSDDQYFGQCSWSSRSRSTGALWIGYCLTFLSLFYTALKSDTMSILAEHGNEVDEHAQELVSSDQSVSLFEIKAVGNDSDSDESSETEKSVNSYASKVEGKRSNLYFHGIMTLSACYFAMLFTNWGTSSSISTTGVQSFWVNIACQWTTYTLFTWTIIAPFLCPTRFRV